MALYRRINTDPPVYNRTNQQAQIQQINAAMAENIPMGTMTTGPIQQLNNQLFEVLHDDKGMVSQLYDEKIDHNTKLIINISRKIENLKLQLRSFPNQQKQDILEVVGQIFIYFRPLLASYKVENNIPIDQIRGDPRIISEYNDFVGIVQRLYNYVYNGTEIVTNIIILVYEHQSLINLFMQQAEKYKSENGDIATEKILSTFLNSIKSPMLIYNIFEIFGTAENFNRNLENIYENIVINQLFDEEFLAYINAIIIACNDEIQFRKKIYTKLYSQITNTFVLDLSDPFNKFMFSKLEIDHRELDEPYPKIIVSGEIPESQYREVQSPDQLLGRESIPQLRGRKPIPQLRGRKPVPPSKPAKQLSGFANPIFQEEISRLSNLQEGLLEYEMELNEEYDRRRQLIGRSTQERRLRVYTEPQRPQRLKDLTRRRLLSRNIPGVLRESTQE